MKYSSTGMFATFALAMLFASMASGEDVQPAAVSAEEFQAFGKERLTVVDGWTQYECKLKPAADGKNATIEFPAGKWSALIGTLPLGTAIKAKFQLRIRCRWVGDSSQVKPTGINFVFLDASKKDISASPVKPILADVADWQDVALETDTPVNAAAIRFDLSSHGGGTLEIESYSLSISNINLSAADIKKSKMTWLRNSMGVKEDIGTKIFGNERLTSEQGWTIHESHFIPAANGRNATLAFPPGKWSALIGSLPLTTKNSGSFLVKVRCRWTGDFSNVKHTALMLMFMDSDKVEIKGVGANQVIESNAGWQDIFLEVNIPKDADALRFDISSQGGGTLEIASYELYMRDF